MFRTIINWVSKVLYGFSMGLCFSLAMIILYNVILRYIFNRPTFWAEEVSSYMLVAITWLAAPELLRREQHIKLDLFSTKFSSTIRNPANIAISIVSITFLGVLTWQGGFATYIVFIKHMSTPTILGTPLFIPYLFIPLGASLLTIHLLIRIVKDIMHKYGRRL